MKKLITFHILKFKLKKMGFRMLDLERIFELPVNDFKKYSPEKLALLRIAKCFPGVVKSCVK